MAQALDESGDSEKSPTKLARVDYGRPLLECGSLPYHRVDTFYMDEKKVQESSTKKSWAPCDSTKFDVRIGPDYVPGQKAPSLTSLYTVFAADGYSMAKKVNNIHHYVDLESHIDKYRHKSFEYDRYLWPLPPVISINVMVPDYAPSMMSTKVNGKGYQLVFYARIGDHITSELEKYRSALIKKCENISNDSEKEMIAKETAKEMLSPSIRLFNEFIHGGPDSVYRQRFKCIARLMNLGYCGFSFLTNRLVTQYNGKPFLARTSSTFYHEKGRYFAVDIDAHLFGYPARQGLSYVKTSMPKVIYDMGFVIEGHTNDELPEQVLCCARVSQVGKEEAVEFPKHFIDIQYSQKINEKLRGNHAATTALISSSTHTTLEKQSEEKESEDKPASDSPS